MSHRRWIILLFVTALGTTLGGVDRALAQPARSVRSDSVPREYRPPSGMCRVWVEGVPAAQQPAPTDCGSAVRSKPTNGKVVYGDDASKGSKQPTVPIKGFMKPVEKKSPPLIPPDAPSIDPRVQREHWESKRISDEQLFGDRPANSPASSFPGMTPSPSGPMGSYSGYVGPSGTVIGTGAINDPRYFNNNPNVKPPGYGSSVCLDRDGDGWCDDSRYGPPVCLDKDQDGRCDDLPAYASQAYPQTLPHMRSVLDVIQGRQSTEIMTWLGTNEFTLRVPDQGRGGTPWRAIFLDQAGALLQVWTDTNRDGLADRVEVFKNGQRVKLLQR